MQWLEGFAGKSWILVHFLKARKFSINVVICFFMKLNPSKQSKSRLRIEFTLTNFLLTHQNFRLWRMGLLPGRILAYFLCNALWKCMKYENIYSCSIEIMILSTIWGDFFRDFGTALIPTLLSHFPYVNNFIFSRKLTSENLPESDFYDMAAASSGRIRGHFVGVRLPFR